MTRKVYKGTQGADKISFTHEEDADLHIFGLGGDDVIHGGVANDVLEGGSGNDVLFGWLGEDLLLGGEGDDEMGANSAGDAMYGGAGNDLYYVRNDGGADPLVSEGYHKGLDTVVFIGDSYALPANVERLFANVTETDGVHLFGNGLNNLIRGADYADQLSGEAGDDVLQAGAGNDDLYGGSGDDVLNGGLGNDRMWGGIGNDRYFVDAGDQIFEAAGGGVDWVVVTKGSHVLSANVENLEVIGGSGAQGIGNGLGNTMTGGQGADYFNGMAGNDTLVGAGGNDVLVGDLGADTLSGGDGNDVIHGGSGNDRLDGGSGNDSLKGDAGEDKILGGAGMDQLWGGAGNDTLDGGDARDTLTGDAGKDRLIGREGDDVLRGGAGNDVLYGLEDNDVLEGGTGADLLIGGGQTDWFTFRTAQDSTVQSRDIILDFQQGEDRIDLSLIDATTQKAGNGAFVFTGQPSFFDGAGELSIDYVGGNTILSADVNGDMITDLSIEMMGVFKLTSADFIL
jgi:Ca2+-binding RTX toxin-like protein